MLAYCDNTGGEPLAWMLRRGSAGNNTAADHIALADTAIAALPPVFWRRLMITTDGAGASHDLIAHLDKLAARRGYQLAYPAGWALTGREKAALRLVPEQAWQAAIDPRGKVRDCRADDACGNSQCAHRPCWIEEAHGQPPATPRAWHRHFPPSRGPCGPEEAPDLAHHQEWTMGMQRPKLEGGLCAAVQAAGKRPREMRGERYDLDEHGRNLDGPGCAGTVSQH